MKYYSLNHNAPKVSFQEAVILGLAPDKGLYFPENITPLPTDFFENIENLSNEEIAFQAIHQFVGDEIPEINLKQIIAETLCFDFPTVKVEDYIYALELYHETKEFDNNEIYPYRIEGLGKNLIPTATDFDVIDKFTKVTDEESAHATREIAKKEGLFVGYTSGAVLQAIKQYAEEGEFDTNSNVIAIFPDHGSRYMSKVFSDEWMNDQGFFDSVNAEEVQKIEFIK